MGCFYSAATGRWFAFRDLAAWVEKGVRPPDSINYRMVNVGQIEVPADAAARGGIQPVVRLRANGSARVEAAANQPVDMVVRADAPPRMGKIVKIEWYSGEGRVTFEASPVDPAASVEMSKTFTYSKPGTYYPAARATLQRDGNPNDFVQIQNLDQMRVVVR